MLEPRGFYVDCCATGEEGPRKALPGGYDVMVLNAVLPGIHGLEVAKKLRDAGRMIPILMLTGNNTTDFLVQALEAGADDFLGKPFESKELQARVRALSRRGKVVPHVEIGPLLIDPLRRTLSARDQEVRLTGIELRILLALVSAEGEYVSHSELMGTVWDLDFDPGTNLVYSHITNLRRKLGEFDLGHMIDSSRGDGYRIVKN